MNFIPLLSGPIHPFRVDRLQNPQGQVQVQAVGVAVQFHAQDCTDAPQPVIQGVNVNKHILAGGLRLVAHGTRDQTPHLGTFEATMKAVLADVPEFHPGDVYAFSDPWRGGTHAQDIRLIRPVFVYGEVFCFTIALCH